MAVRILQLCLVFAVGFPIGPVTDAIKATKEVNGIGTTQTYKWSICWAWTEFCRLRSTAGSRCIRCTNLLICFEEINPGSSGRCSQSVAYFPIVCT
ncbi:hypothetical protein YQE_05472, partial [Dendroctonus ponderosae]